MTQMFREDGTMIPVTVVLAGPCPVVQIKSAEHRRLRSRAGSLQAPSAKSSCTKPMLGHLKKAGVAAHRYTREFKLDDTAAYEVGQVIKADVFANGDQVDVTGHEQGQGLRGQHQALESGPRPQDPRFPLLPRCRLHGRLHLPRRGIQDQAPARPHGLRAHHGSEP